MKLADKYIFNRFNPDKSIDILDSVCAHVQITRPNKKNCILELQKKKDEYLSSKKYKEALNVELEIKKEQEVSKLAHITYKDIIKIVEYRANMPVLDTFNDNIINLSKRLKKNIYGQDKAIDEVCEALKEKYLVDNTKPLSILLSGPTGVGKTLLAKEIATHLFGDKQFLRLDMNELSGDGALNRLLGSPQGYVGYEDEALLSKIKDYPYSVILLDEIEKISPKIQKLFIEILENGTIRNNKGETIHFENTTIIMTTNRESQSSIGFRKESIVQKEFLDKDFKNHILKNIIMSKIEKESAKKYIKRETSTLKLSKKDIDEIIENSKIDIYGLRGVQKELNKYKINKLLTKV